MKKTSGINTSVTTPSSVGSEKLFWWQYLKPRFWLTWAGVGLMVLSSLLPFVVIAIIGSGLGLLLLLLHRGRRQIALTNLEKCFPQWTKSERSRILRKNFMLTGRAALEAAVAWWAPRWRLRALVKCNNDEIYQSALASGRPVILLVGHFTSVEIVGMYLSSRDAVIDIYKPPHNQLMHAIVRNRRLRFDGNYMLAVKDGIKPVIRTMKNGAVLYYLPDQDPGRRHSVFVPFMNIQTATFSVLGKLARLTNALVIPCEMRHLPWARGIEVTFRPPLTDFPKGDDIEDTAAMNQAIEQAVRRMPEEYFWVHKRFKTRPEGEERFY